MDTITRLGNVTHILVDKLLYQQVDRVHIGLIYSTQQNDNAKETHWIQTFHTASHNLYFRII